MSPVSPKAWANPALYGEGSSFIQGPGMGQATYFQKTEGHLRFMSAKHPDV